ncbi:MAG: 4-hydroxy-tetrahydrodipicolinate reductase [Clostridia bacterium]|nr:4-hydroxy-tetrahydrodipicolinate reductase [Clostridia bacterium]
MTGILVSGYSGTMGKNVVLCSEKFEDIFVMGGVDKFKTPAPFPTFEDFDSVNVEFDVIVDFSNSQALDGLLAFALKTKKPIVLGTTGFSDEQKNKINEASKEIAIFSSANMSLGVNLMTELASMAAKVLGNDYDIEILEMHHNQKVDAPSGTALMLADAISDSLDEKPEYNFDRHSKREKRKKNEIGFASLRGGTVVGEHEVIFAGTDEVIKLSHSAYSKALFANGALNAARFIVGKEPRIYTMKDLINS